MVSRSERLRAYMAGKSVVYTSTLEKLRLLETFVEGLATWGCKQTGVSTTPNCKLSDCVGCRARRVLQEARDA